MFLNYIQNKRIGLNYTEPYLPYRNVTSVNFSRILNLDIDTIIGGPGAWGGRPPPPILLA